MVPSKLKRHFSSKHGHLLGKDLEYFRRLLKEQNKQSVNMMKTVKISDKAQEASFAVVDLVAKKKKPHTVAEK